MTALCMAIEDTFGSRPVLLALEGHGREEILPGLDITRTVGWFSTV
ncbi:MAG: hypothetical protein GY940_18030 [bacterium]|nr:hypothetical protein [bacterium]